VRILKVPHMVQGGAERSCIRWKKAIP